jgi:sigma-B regulation protein RsbU (phosphoserine phosphatase)
MTLAGFPLGMFDEVTYDEVTITLDPGDILIFYSDGVTDVRNASGEFYGSDRLREFLIAHGADSAAAIADRLLEEVEVFSGMAPAFDDRTLVVLKAV